MKRFLSGLVLGASALVWSASGTEAKAQNVASSADANVQFVQYGYGYGRGYAGRYPGSYRTNYAPYRSYSYGSYYPAYRSNYGYGYPSYGYNAYPSYGYYTYPGYGYNRGYYRPGISLQFGW